MNGDIRTHFNYATWLKRLHHNLPASSLAHLVLVDNPNHNPNGDFNLNPGIEPFLRDTTYPLVTAPLSSNRRFTFSGLSMLHKDLFLGLDIAENTPAPLAPLLRKAIASGQATGELMSAKWMDIGTIERRNEAEIMFRAT